MKYAIIQMLKQGSGAIVNTASIMGLVGSWSGTSAYNASKHGVVGLTKPRHWSMPERVSVSMRCVRAIFGPP